MTKPFTAIAVLFLALIALVHLWRLFFPFRVDIAGTALPTWVSAIGLVVAGGLSFMLWRESRR